MPNVSRSANARARICFNEAAGADPADANQEPLTYYAEWVFMLQ